MFNSPYQTTAFVNYRFNKLSQTLRQLEIQEQLIPIEGPSRLKAVPPTVKDIVPFTLWLTPNEIPSMNSEVIVDGRPFLKHDGSVSNQSLYELYRDGATIINRWVNGKAYDVMSAAGDLAVKIYSQWFRNAMTQRLNLDFGDTYLVQAVGAIFFIQQGNPLTNNSSGSDVDRILTKAARALPMTDLLTLSQRVGDVPPLSTLEDAVEWIKELIQSPRIESLTMPLARQASLNIWPGQYKEMSAAAVEYPPVFILMIYYSIKSRGFIHSTLGDLVKKNVKQNDALNFIRSMDTFFSSVIQTEPVMYSTNNLLIDHAYRNVWCGPGQDTQHIVSPVRISPERGALWSTPIDNSQYNLPTQGDRYDVFVFSDILPELVGMADTKEIWIPAVNYIKTTPMSIYLFNKEGVFFPLQLAWFLYTRMGNLVIALKRNDHAIKWVELVNGEYKYNPLFVRWRSPAVYKELDDSYRKLVDYSYLEYKGNNIDYQTWRNRLIEQKALYPTIKVYHNGFRVRDFDTNVLRGNDHLEWYYESDIRRTIEYKLSELPSFESELDGTRKYLLTRSQLGEGIDFVDDIDVYIKNYTKANYYNGIYYHQARVDSIRMVTHRDYALKSAYVHAAILNQGWSLNGDIRIELVVRYSGYDRALVDEAHRIKELFKLDDVSRVNAMVGSDSGVGAWKASELENSMYLKLMSAPYHSLTVDNVIEAYGYNAVARILGDLPTEVEVGNKFIKLKRAQQQACTVYEYSAQGQMLGFYVVEGQTQYALRHPNTKYAEVLIGKGGISLEVSYNVHTTTRVFRMDPKRAYRVYKGLIGTSGSVGYWEDVTGDEEVYTLNEQREVIWNQVGNGVVTAIKNDLDFLSKTFTLPNTDGAYVFTVGTEEVYPGVSDVYEMMSLKPGEYDVFLNGWDLVEGIDFYCNWPEFCIVNKRYLDHTKEAQEITVRARGFCTKELETDHQIDSGFIIHNQLSRNATFNLRDDKVTRVTVGGALKLKESLGFAEDGTLVDAIPNGTPYKISHPYIPLMVMVPEDTYDYRERANVVDKQIEGYMDEYHKEDEVLTPNPIPERYPVVSPFISKIIEDMKGGFITTDEMESYLTVQEVKERFKGYTYLLAYDPTVREERDDLFKFTPHQYKDLIDLDLYQYRVVEMLIRAYLNNRIELSRYVRIVERI